MSEDEQRDRMPAKLSRLAFAKDGDLAHVGLLTNISASGAAIEFVYPTGTVKNPFVVGETVELEIDEIGHLNGTIRRADDRNIAVEFTAESAEDEELIAKIMAAQSKIELGF